MKMYPRKESGYLLHRQLQATAKAKKAKKAVRKEKIQKGSAAAPPPSSKPSVFFNNVCLPSLVKAFEKGCQDFQKEMFSDGYHVYRDPTTFAYDITLARANLVSNKNERFHLKVPSPFPLFPLPPPLIHNQTHTPTPLLTNTPALRIPHRTLSLRHLHQILLAGKPRRPARPRPHRLLLRNRPLRLHHLLRP